MVMKKLSGEKMKKKVKKNTPLNNLTNILSGGFDRYNRNNLIKSNGAASLKNIFDMMGIKNQRGGARYQEIQGIRLTNVEKINIENNYNSNNETKGWYKPALMETKNYYFILAIDDALPPNKKIVGQVGIDVTNLELGYDVINQTHRGQNIYPQLLKERIIFIRNNPQLKTKIFYLFTEKIQNNIINNVNINNSKIKNHLNSGLILIDKTINANFTSSINHKSYINFDGKEHLAFRSPEDNLSRNYVSYTHSNGTCSGLYIGQRLIITADHCYHDNFNEPPMIIYNLKIGDKNITLNENDKPHIFKSNILRLQITAQFTDVAILQLPITYDNQLDNELERVIIYNNPVEIANNDYLSIWGSKLQQTVNDIKLNSYNIGEIQTFYNNGNFPPFVLDKIRNNNTPAKYLQGIKTFVIGFCRNAIAPVEGDSGGPVYYKNALGQNIVISVIGSVDGSNFNQCARGINTKCTNIIPFIGGGTFPLYNKGLDPPIDVIQINTNNFNLDALGPPGVFLGVSTGVSPGVSTGVSPGVSPGVSTGVSPGVSTGRPQPTSTSTGAQQPEQSEEEEKTTLETRIINSGQTTQPYNIDSNIQQYDDLSEKGITRIIEQLLIMEKTIPEIKNLDGAVVGKDMITELVRQEKMMKLMTKNALINANTIYGEQQNNEHNYPLEYKNNEQIINNKMETLNNKMNDINILFKKLFHRRSKLSSVPTVWVN